MIFAFLLPSFLHSFLGNPVETCIAPFWRQRSHDNKLISHSVSWLNVLPLYLFGGTFIRSFLFITPVFPLPHSVYIGTNVYRCVYSGGLQQEVYILRVLFLMIYQYFVNHFQASAAVDSHCEPLSFPLLAHAYVYLQYQIIQF